MGSQMALTVTKFTADFVPEADRAEARVIDFAAGTGRVGKGLHKLGFRKMDEIGKR